jgi:hypothetical protein
MVLTIIIVMQGSDDHNAISSSPSILTIVGSGLVVIIIISIIIITIPMSFAHSELRAHGVVWQVPDPAESPSRCHAAAAPRFPGAHTSGEDHRHMVYIPLWSVTQAVRITNNTRRMVYEGIVWR